MNKTKLLCIFISVVCLFCGCSSVKSGTDSFKFGNTNPSNGLSGDAGTVPGGSSDDSPGIGMAMFTSADDAEVFSPLVYDGEDVEFYCRVESSINQTVCRLGFTIDGVYQDFKIEDDGVLTDYNIFHEVQMPPNSVKTVKIILKPGIGRSGDRLGFCNASISNSGIKVQELNKTYGLGDVRLTSTLASVFTLNVDSAQSVEICTNYSGLDVVPCKKIIRKFFEDHNGDGAVCQSLIFYDLDSEMYYDSYKNIMYSAKLEVPRADSVPLTVALGGGRWGTAQRVSVYVNGEIMPVFDGKYYADVPIEKNKQTNLNITLDTADLDEWNNIYVLSYTLDDSIYTDASAFNQSDVYVLKVTD